MWVRDVRRVPKVVNLSRHVRLIMMFAFTVSDLKLNFEIEIIGICCHRNSKRLPLNYATIVFPIDYNLSSSLITLYVVEDGTYKGTSMCLERIHYRLKKVNAFSQEQMYIVLCQLSF